MPHDQGVLRRRETGFRSKNAHAAKLLATTVIALVPCAAAAQSQAQSTPSATTTAPEKDIVVTARRSEITEKIDRSVYEIQTGPDGASSNTIDVVRRLPGVTIGPGDSVSIRGGARVSYLINGRPVRQEVALAVPASQIARVEVIANPSAELDARGDALINLIIKQTANAGWSGNASSQTDTLGGIRAGLDVAKGGSAWTLNANVSFRSTPLRTATHRTTEFLVPGSSALMQTLDVDNQTTTNRLSMQLRVNRGKEGEDLTSIILGSSFNYVPQKERILQTSTTVAGGDKAILARMIRFHGSYPFAIASIDRKLGNGFSLKGNINSTAGSSSDRRATGGDVGQVNTEKLRFAFVEPGVTIQKVFGRRTLSIGTTFSINPVSSEVTADGVVLPDGSTTQDARFHFDRDQFALFASLEGRFLGVDAKSAIRFENISQRFADDGGPLDGLHRITRVLPSLFLSTKLGENDTVKASATFRSDLPDAQNLNPTRRFLSPFFAEQGNPFLIPSLKRLFDATYVFDKVGVNISQSIYFRTVAHDVARYDTSYLGGITVSTFANLASSRTLGYSLLMKAKVTRRFQLGGGVDFFRRTAAASGALSYLGRVRYESVDANATADFALDNRSSISAQWSYQGQSYDPGLRTASYSTSEIKASRKIAKRISLDIALADVAVPLGRNGRFSGANLVGSERVLRRSRLFRIGLSSPL